MCHNCEQGHKHIRRACLTVEGSSSFFVFCSPACFIGMTRVTLPKLFTVPGEGHFLAAVQLPNKSSNKRQCRLSIRFYNWIIIGQRVKVGWLRLWFSKCHKAIEMNYTTLKRLLRLARKKALLRLLCLAKPSSSFSLVLSLWTLARSLLVLIAQRLWLLQSGV